MSIYTETMEIRGPSLLMPAHILSSPEAMFPFDSEYWITVAPQGAGEYAMKTVAAPNVPVSSPAIIHDGPMTFAFLPPDYYSYASAPPILTTGMGPC